MRAEMGLRASRVSKDFAAKDKVSTLVMLDLDRMCFTWILQFPEFVDDELTHFWR